MGFSCRYMWFLFCLGCSSRPRTKYFFLTVHYMYLIPLYPSSSKLGRQPCWTACLLVCVSGFTMAGLCYSIFKNIRDAGAVCLVLVISVHCLILRMVYSQVINQLWQKFTKKTVKIFNYFDTYVLFRISLTQLVEAYSKCC
jgi:hypothetical protein